MADSQMLRQNVEEIKGDKLFYGGHNVLASPGVHESALKIMKDHVREGARVLELGAGTGAFTLRLKEQGYQVTASGIEPHIFTLKEVPFSLFDINGEIPEEHRGQYEAVAALEVIEHLENVFDCFRKIYDLLTPNGIALITTPNISAIRSRLIFLKSGNFSFFNINLMEQWGHIQILPSWLIIKGAEKAGFNYKISGVGGFREDLLPWWQNFLTKVMTYIFNILSKERFVGEFSNSTILLLLFKN
ncbi:MAG: class I SAM-dependent methyltransferase [Thermodesulfobacteriota bacterium]